MTGPASTAQWLVCSGIGCGIGAILLGLVKLALDTGVEAPAHAPRLAAYQPRHAAPLALVETQPIRVLHHARHAREAT